MTSSDASRRTDSTSPKNPLDLRGKEDRKPAGRHMTSQSDDRSPSAQSRATAGQLYATVLAVMATTFVAAAIGLLAFLMPPPRVEANPARQDPAVVMLSA